MSEYDLFQNLWNTNWYTKNIQIKEIIQAGVLVTDVFGIKGFLNKGDIYFLWNVGMNLPKGGKYLEVGSWQGLSSIVVSMGLVSNYNFEGQVYCVDPWEIMPEQEMFSKFVQQNDLYQVFCENIEKTQMKHFIHPLRGKSVEVAEKVNEQFDVIFIDGEHTFEGCYTDIKAWLPKLKKEGKMFGHDAYPGGGVINALEKIKSEEGINYKINEPPFTHYMWEFI